MSVQVQIPPLADVAPVLKQRVPPLLAPLGQGGMDPMMDRKVSEKPYKGCCGK